MIEDLLKKLEFSIIIMYKRKGNMQLTVLTVNATKSWLTTTSVPIESTVTNSTILTGVAVTVMYLYKIKIKAKRKLYRIV